MAKPYIIGISGGSGSGKTTFLRKIKKDFERSEVCVISQDDYYRPREDQEKDPHGVINFDLPQCIDEASFVRDVQRVIRGETVKRQEYVFNNEKARARVKTYIPAPVMVIEGLFVFLNPEIRKLVDLKIFIHAHDIIKVIRRIKRDRSERNYPVEDVLYRYENHVLPTYRKYVEPFKEDADMVINNNRGLTESFKVIKAFIRMKLDL